MILQNLHTHTVFGDGAGTPERMARRALAAGCASLGFSEHSPLPPGRDPDGWTMAAAEEAAYRAEVLRLREEYAGRMDVLLGIELDNCADVTAEGFDYWIGSVHYLRDPAGRRHAVDWD